MVKICSYEKYLFELRKCLNNLLMRDKNAANNLQLKMGCFLSLYQLIVPQNGLDKKNCNKSKIDLVNFYVMHNAFSLYQRLFLLCNANKCFVQGSISLPFPS